MAALTALSVPVTVGVVSSVFGPRKHPVTGEEGTLHKGIDIAAKEGTPVLAAGPGVIEAVNENSETGGKVIVVRHDDGMSTVYMHLSRIILKAGQRVFSRTVIGLVGHTGRVTGDHLHFEVRDKNGNAVDPGPLWGLKPAIITPAVGMSIGNTALLGAALVLGLVVLTVLGGKA